MGRLGDGQALNVAYEGEYLKARWRVGRKLGRTIYAMESSEPTDADHLIGVMDTPALARAAVEGHNERIDAGRPFPWKADPLRSE